MTHAPHPGVRIVGSGAPRPVAASGPVGRAPGLSDLSRVTLSAEDQARYERVKATARGTAPWLARVRREAFELLALGTIAPRLTVLDLSIEVDLRAVLGLVVPVPCKPSGCEEVVMANRALLGFNWPVQVLTTQLPGWSFLHIEQPRPVFLPNVSATPQQGLCLGTTMPVGIRVRELVLAAYAALSGQSMQADERDPAGVLNIEAARYYQARPGLTPFSKVPFLGTEDLGISADDTRENQA